MIPSYEFFYCGFMKMEQNLTLGYLKLEFESDLTGGVA